MRGGSARATIGAAPQSVNSAIRPIGKSCLVVARRLAPGFAGGLLVDGAQRRVEHGASADVVDAHDQSPLAATLARLSRGQTVSGDVVELLKSAAP